MNAGPKYRKEQLKGFFTDLVREFRWGSFLATIALACIGFFFVYSATYRTGSETHAIPAMVKQQVIYFAVGLALYLLVAVTDYEWICEKSWLFYLAVLAMLIAVVFFPHIGLSKFTKSMYGATRWLKFGSVQIQPSEFAKLACLLMIAYYLFRASRHMDTWRVIFIAGALIGLPAALIMKQPDLGTAMVLAPMLFAMLFIAGANWRYLTLIIVSGLLVAVLAYQVPKLHLLKQHQRDRIDVFL
ncbi:MAG: FtsW/RodA/SpoVE family cell cycle protein, partial [Verrucomicrobiae bacterium]|nr:FtsW/RodA/SpoVE family cell cycle protein [Verrucomicrobiae bacterium]